MSRRAIEGMQGGGAEAGFMLLEVLVAIVIASLMMAVIGRALAQGWRSTRIPLEVASAVALARADLQRGTGDAPPDVPHDTTLDRRVRTATLIARPSPVAPAPLAAASTETAVQGGPKANDVMPGVTEHPDAAGSHSGALQWITVVVRLPSGRRVGLETLHLDAAPN